MSEIDDPNAGDVKLAAQDGNAPGAPKLRTFDGGPGPAVVEAAWSAYRELDDPLRRELPELLRGILETPNDPANDGRFKAFCSHFDVSSDVLGVVVQGLNLLIGHASALGIEPIELRADLLTLGEGEASVSDPIVELYAALRPLLRARLVDETLADHGRLLVGVDWRVDELKISDRGVGLDTSVMHLTLRYREGNETSRVSFQLVPEMARRLRDACARVVG
jgi:hypothetical protein